MRGCGRMKDKPKYVCGSLTKDEIIHILNERNKLLVKALDKACYMLNGYMAHEWKDYLLKEVQEDE